MIKVKQNYFYVISNKLFRKFRIIFLILYNLVLSPLFIEYLVAHILYYNDFTPFIVSLKKEIIFSFLLKENISSTVTSI